MMLCLADVLPTHIDEALNVAVLQEAVDRLGQFQAQARAQLFCRLQQQCQAGPDQLDAALEELCGCAGTLLPDSPEAVLAQYAAHFRQLCSQLAALSSAQAEGAATADLEQQLQEVLQLMTAGQLSEAAWGLARLQRTLQEQQQQLQQQQQEGEGAAPGARSAAWQGLAARLQQCEEDMKKALTHAVSQLVRLDPPTSALAPSLSSSPWPRRLLVASHTQPPLGSPCGAAPAAEVWAALAARGELQSQLQGVAQLVLGQVLPELLQGRCSTQLSCEGRQAEGAGEGLQGGGAGPGQQLHVLSWQEAAGPGQACPPEAACRKVLQLLADHALGLEPGLVRVLGDVLWRPLADLYLCLVLEPAAATALDQALGPAGAGVVERGAGAGGEEGGGVSLQLSGLPGLAAGLARCDVLLEAAQGLEEWAESMELLEEAYLAPAAAARLQQLVGRVQQAPLEAARTALGRDGLDGEVLVKRVGRPLPLDAPFCTQLLSGQLKGWQAEDPPCGLLLPPLTSLNPQPSPGAEGAAGGGAAAEAGLGGEAGSRGGGWLPLGAEGESSVGQGAAELAELMTHTLHQAWACGHPSAASALVAAVRSMAVMARCLPLALPTEQQALHAVPRLALLRHNALRHLAATLLVATAVYSPGLEVVSGAPVGLLEQALLLRHAAAACLQDQVQAQVAVLQELLGGLQGLSSLGVRARGAGAAKAGLALRKVINQVLHSLSRLGRVLVELLAPEPLVQVCSEVLGAVCSSVVGDVMAKADLGVEDCKELQLLLGPLATDCLTALLPGTPPRAPHSAADPAQDPQLSGLPLHLLHACVLGRCTPLRKLRTLTQLLDAPMRDIVALWEQRELQAAGFDPDDVQHLLCALFEASEYRRDALARVAASSW